MLQIVLKSVVMHPTVGQSHCHHYVINLAICCSHHPHSQEVDVEWVACLTINSGASSTRPQCLHSCRKQLTSLQDRNRNRPSLVALVRCTFRIVELEAISGSLLCKEQQADLTQSLHRSLVSVKGSTLRAVAGTDESPSKCSLFMGTRR